MKQILGYGVYWLCYIVIPLPIMLFVFVTGWITGKSKSLAIIFTFLFDGIAYFITVMVSIWLCTYIDARPTWLMFFIPVIFIILNDLRRISIAEHRRDIQQTNNKREDEIRVDNVNLAVALENAHFYGDLVGLLAGALFFLPKMQFI